MFASLIIGLILALGGNAYLWSKADQSAAKLNTLQNTTEQQIARLSEATTTILEERLGNQSRQMDTVLKETEANAKTALAKARTDAERQNNALTAKLEEQRKQIADQLAMLQAADSKIGDVSTQVSDVSTKVSTVASSVDAVKADVNTTQADLKKTGSDLARVTGDLGVLSGLIATNGKELAALRQLGERNYYEFALNRKDTNKKVNDIALTLKKTDPKRNRYTVEIMADDRKVEKKDRNVNEPVQMLVAGNREPYEIVVNQVTKDQVIGYLSVPKVTTKR
jgi:chromosome segregation ATPase